MITLRPAAARGHTALGWLSSRHTFSFGDYHDPAHMGFRDLRVINEDRVEPGQGFATHGHRDMEILSWVLTGALEHKDSLGTGSVIRPGELQRMSAGTGVTHSEYNHSRTEPVHFLQIWILPERRGIAPSYEQRAFPETETRNRLRLIAARDGRDRSVTIHQDVAVHATRLDAGERVAHALATGRHAWVQAVRGGVAVNGRPLIAGDGVSISDEATVEILGGVAGGEALLFDLV